ncbi:MAG: histidine phosphatase family protein [Planctomycetaceae bacterium]|nr:histidine phosphatase family protein [Planctomycetaceae bacterium]
MATLYIIAAGKSLWQQEQRIESPAGSPLAEGAAEEVRRWAAELTGRGIEAVYTGPGEQEIATAEILAAVLDAKARVEEDLHEMDFGLWQGLLANEIKRRQAKVYKLWTESPSAVRPPEGETMAQAQQRLGEAMKALVRKHKDESLLVVLRPMALALVRCLLDGLTLDTVRSKVLEEFTWASYEMDSREL